MTTTHNLGFPRIGAKRELKFALESYWKGESSLGELKALGAQLRQRHWAHQAGLGLAAVGDFAFYDQVLDMSFTLGNLPERVHGFHGDTLDNYFRVARGRSAKGAEDHSACCGGVAAGEMTKWFDTNYHYIVPEFSASTEFKLDPSRLLEQLAEAKAQGVKVKPVIVGPVTYLALGKAKDDSDKLALLPRLLAGLRGTAGYAGRARRRMGSDRRADSRDGTVRAMAAGICHRIRGAGEQQSKAVAGHVLRPVARQPEPRLQAAGARPASGRRQRAALKSKR